MAPINDSDDDDDDDDDGVVGSGMWLPLMTVDPTWGASSPSISSITQLECANTKHQILINAGRPHDIVYLLQDVNLISFWELFSTLQTSRSSVKFT